MANLLPNIMQASFITKYNLLLIEPNLIQRLYEGVKDYYIYIVVLI